MNSEIAFAELGERLKFQALDDESNEKVDHAVSSGKNTYFLAWNSDHAAFRWMIRHHLVAEPASQLTKTDQVIIFINSPFLPGNVTLEDNKGHVTVVDTQAIRIIKKDWYRIGMSSPDLDWASIRVRSAISL
jgi:hypothetical protein